MSVFSLSSCRKMSKWFDNDVEVKTDTVIPIKNVDANPNENAEREPNDDYSKVRAKQLKGYIFREVNSEGDSIFFYDRVFKDSVMESDMDIFNKSNFHYLVRLKVVYVMFIHPNNPEQYYAEYQYFVECGQIKRQKVICKRRDGTIQDSKDLYDDYESPFPNTLVEDVLMWAEDTCLHRMMEDCQ